MLAVLVTGAWGFVGSRLVDRLVQRGDSVSVLLREGRSTNPNATVERGDITYPDFEFGDDSYDVVYHLAAVWPGEKDRRKQRRVNLDGAVNLFG